MYELSTSGNGVSDFFTGCFLRRDVRFFLRFDFGTSMTISLHESECRLVGDIGESLCVLCFVRMFLAAKARAGDIFKV